MKKGLEPQQEKKTFWKISFSFYFVLIPLLKPQGIDDSRHIDGFNGYNFPLHSQVFEVNFIVPFFLKISTIV